MPAYDDRHHKGRGVHGKFTISSGAEKESGLYVHSSGVTSSAARDAGSYISGEAIGRPSHNRSDESESPQKKKSRGWFGGRKNTKKSGGISDGVIDGVIEGKNVTRSSPMLRSGMRTGDKDQFGRPQTLPDEEEEEEMRMQLSYDAPVDFAKGKLNQKLRSRPKQ